MNCLELPMFKLLARQMKNAPLTVFIYFVFFLRKLGLTAHAMHELSGPVFTKKFDEYFELCRLFLAGDKELNNSRYGFLFMMYTLIICCLFGTRFQVNYQAVGCCLICSGILAYL